MAEVKKFHENQESEQMNLVHFREIEPKNFFLSVHFSFAKKLKNLIQFNFTATHIQSSFNRVQCWSMAYRNAQQAA